MPARLLASLLMACSLVLTGIVNAQNDVLFEDLFSGPDGTVLPTGSSETYQIVGRDGTVMTPTLQNDQLELSIGPNTTGSNSFSVLHQNTAFDFETQPLLFEADVDLGDAVTVVFGLHTWLGNSRIDASSNHLVVTFYNNGDRLLLTGRNGGEANDARYEVNGFTDKEMKIGLYLDETEVKFLLDGVVVYSDAHDLDLSAFSESTYLGMQLYGGGEDNVHTATFDNLRVVADPDLTPEPTTVFSDDFSGDDGEISVGSGETYETAVRDGGVLSVEREGERMKLSMGPNTSGSSTFGMLHHASRLRFDEAPLLFEVDVDINDMTTFAIGLHDWLGNDTLMYGNNVSVTKYGGDRLLLITRNGGAETETRYDTGADGFPAQTFRLGLYLDETDLKLLIDGELLYESPHNLAQTLLDNGVYFGVQLYGGGDGIVQTSYLDNLSITANPDLDIPEVIPGDIYWANATEIRSSRFDGSEVQTIVSNLGRPIGLAVDFDSEQMYWVEHDNGTLMRANTDGSDVTELRNDLETGQLLAFDPVGDRLYWAEWDEGLFFGPSDGSDRQEIISDVFNSNAGVAVSDERAFLVSANSGAVTSIALDGSGSTETVTTFAGETYDIAIDPAGEEMFATNFSENWIKAYDFVSGDTRTVWEGDLSRPLGITVSSDGEKLYWAERTLDVANGRIRVANIDGSGSIQTLVAGEASPFGIAVRPQSAASTGFTSWIEDWGLAEGEKGIHDSPAGDGIPNLVKYALGLDPSVASAEALPQPVLEEVDGNHYLSLSVDRNSEATDVSWTFETSNDLETWSSADVVVEESANVVTGVDTVSIEEAPRRFIRVNLAVEE